MCVQIYIFKCEWSNARIVVVWICPIDFAASTVLCPGNKPNITVRIKLKTIPYVSRQRCMCRTGFRLQADGLTCKDVDECGEGSRPACAHLCLNSRGSFLCQCHPGFLLEADGRTCKTPGVCEGERNLLSKFKTSAFCISLFFRGWLHFSYAQLLLFHLSVWGYVTRNSGRQKNSPRPFANVYSVSMSVLKWSKDPLHTVYNLCSPRQEVRLRCLCALMLHFCCWYIWWSLAVS